MKATRTTLPRFLLYVLLGTGLGLPLSPSHAVDIPFTAKNESERDIVQLVCSSGLRSSPHPSTNNGVSPDFLTVNARTTIEDWYTTTSGLTSEFGKWDCSYRVADPPDNIRRTDRKEISFCLKDEADFREVVLVLPENAEDMVVEHWPAPEDGICDDAAIFKLGNATNPPVEAHTFRCSQPGAFGRVSDVVSTVSPGRPLSEFYIARDGLSSKFGKWICRYNSVAGEASFAFCLVNDRSVPVVNLELVTTPAFPGPFIKITGSGTGTNSSGNCPTSDTATSFLGDGHSKRPDRDRWFFDGTAGDLLTIQLEGDGRSGSAGKDVTLVLRGHGAARSFRRKWTGQVPLELEESLPADGRYSIKIKQHKIKEADRFFGNYVIRLSSQLGEILAFRPDVTVERRDVVPDSK